MKFKFFLLILFVSTQSFTQILIDVKTSLTEKKELHIIKVAVIRSLDTSKSYRTTEFGEKYSLWLTNLRRTNIRDSIKTDLTIELCGPSFITKGKLLRSKQISVIYPASISYSSKADPDSEITNIFASLLQGSNVSDKLITQLTNDMLSNNFVDIAKIIIRFIILEITKAFHYQPSSREAIEASLLAANVLVETNDLVQSISINSH